MKFGSACVVAGLVFANVGFPLLAQDVTIRQPVKPAAPVARVTFCKPGLQITGNAKLAGVHVNSAINGGYEITLIDATLQDVNASPVITLAATQETARIAGMWIGAGVTYSVTLSGATEDCNNKVSEKSFISIK
jgi:hypothetical protein